MRRYFQEEHTAFSWVLYVVLLVAAFLAQTMLLPHLTIAGVKPDLLLIASVAAGMAKGKNPGMAAGFFLGLLSDVLYGGVIGLLAFSYLVIGYVSGWISDLYYEGDWRLGAILVGCGYIFHELFIYFCSYILRSRFMFRYELTHIFIPGFLYTMAVAAGLYLIVKLISGLLAARVKE